MDKKREEKFCEWLKGFNKNHIAMGYMFNPETANNLFSIAWQACLDANGIESQDDKPYRVYVFKNMNDMKQFAKDRIEPDNPFFDTNIGESYQEPINDLAKTFEALAFAITDASNKITAAVISGIERANAEVINVEAKEWTPKEGDAVFVHSEIGEYARVARVMAKGPRGDYAVTSNPYSSDIVELKNMKPFNPSAIGKSWREI